MKDQYNGPNLCKECGRKPIRIHVEGLGDFCNDCYNQRALRIMGIPDTFKYDENVTVTGPGRKKHKFRISHMICGELVSWEAEEAGSERVIRFCSDVHQDGAHAAEKFLEKIKQVVRTQTFDQTKFRDEYGEMITLPRYIKDKGNINIIDKGNDSCKIAFEIDGERIEAKELENLLTPYTGFQLQYTIRDASDPILGEDEYLVPMKITEEILLEELEEAINIYTDRGGFLSYRDVMSLDTAIYPIMNKLQVFLEAGKKDEAISVGKAMMRRLMRVEHDDDYFPINHLEVIAGIIDPHRIDEEVQNLRTGEY